MRSIRDRLFRRAAFAIAMAGATAAFSATAGMAVAVSVPADTAQSVQRTPDGLIAVGQAAPGFAVPDGSGRVVRLADFRGHPLVLYFYPKDDTPGCTKEACSFRDDFAGFDSLGVRVVGVSVDDPASHRAFAGKYNLHFPLLADTSATVVRLYGAGVEFDQSGEQRWIAKRVTYLIDSGGVVRRVWPKVNPVGHSSEILGAWREMTTGAR